MAAMLLVYSCQTVLNNDNKGKTMKLELTKAEANIVLAALAAFRMHQREKLKQTCGGTEQVHHAAINIAFDVEEKVEAVIEPTN